MQEENTWAGGAWGDAEGITTTAATVTAPALKINCGPPTANLWSDWSPQKRVNRDKLDQRQKMRKSCFLSTVLLKNMFKHQYQKSVWSP